MSSLLVSLKWGKTTYSDGQLSIIHGESSAMSLKLQVQSLTGVPVNRQKLLCPKAWRGALKDDGVLPNDISDCSKGGRDALMVTLIGSAESLTGRSVSPKVDAEVEHDVALCAGDVVDIVALQLEPGFERDDGKVSTYEYNRLVTGLPQHQINDMLLRRSRNSEQGASMPLLGEVAMTMGMELRRAYINSIAVLSNGTIVSGLDDGHVQLWHRGRLVKDARHASGCVDHVCTFPSAVDGPSFVTAGGGMICLWTETGDILWQRGIHSGTSAASIACGKMGDDDAPSGSLTYLAVCFRVTRVVDPNQFRLVPQNDNERRRRDAAMAREMMIQHELLGVTRAIKVWMYDGRKRDSSGNSASVVRESFISFDSREESASIIQLLHTDGGLVSGDVWGVIRKFVLGLESSSPQQCALFQFRRFSIACLEKVQRQLLAVSIQPDLDFDSSRILPSATPLNATSPFGIYIIDEQGTMKVLLDAHTDIVKCICPLPDGGMLTAGGKMDATTRLWDSLVISNAIQSSNSSDDKLNVVSDAKVMKQPGYVFDLKVLPDSNGSSAYAVAAARYNVIKIII